MDNQHKLIVGYRDFNEHEKDAINSIKLAEQDIGQLWQQVAKMEGVDHRCLATAKTQLQQAFSWFVRAVARPVDPFELELPEPEPETHITRLRKERDEVVERLNKLNAFLKAQEESATLPSLVLDELKQQAEVMTPYAFILSKRYDDLTAE